MPSAATSAAPALLQQFSVSSLRAAASPVHPLLLLLRLLLLLQVLLLLLKQKEGEAAPPPQTDGLYIEEAETRTHCHLQDTS